MQENVVTYDIETLSNFFSYVAIDVKTEKQYVFVIWKERNDLPELLQHLGKLKGMIGFNSINFDYPVLHHIMKNDEKLLKKDGEKVAREIYKVAQNTINKEWAQIREPFIPQLDLFKIHHFDNRARKNKLNAASSRN